MFCHAKRQVNILFQVHPPTVETSPMTIKNSKQEKFIMFDLQQLSQETLSGAAGKLPADKNGSGLCNTTP